MKNIKNIKKEIKQIAEKETPQFQSWLQQNNQRINDQLNGAPFRSQTVAKPNRLAKWAIACACMMIFVVVSLPFVLKTTQTPGSPTYENSEVWGLLIDDEKSYEYLHSIGCNLTLTYLNGHESYTQDNELVLANIRGHYEIVGDYYIFNCQSFH